MAKSRARSVPWATSCFDPSRDELSAWLADQCVDAKCTCHVELRGRTIWAMSAEEHAHPTASAGVPTYVGSNAVAIC